jgi:N utilization substance protein B
MGQPDGRESFNDIAKELDLSPKSLEYARHLFEMMEQKSDWASDQLTNLSDNWKLERMAAIDRIILRMALVELELMADVPVKVAINEAIELAKKYSTPESSKFVNGILDSFAKRMEAE